MPLLPERQGNSTEFDALEVLVFRGAKGSYTQYDDNGGTIDFTFDGEKLTDVPSENCKTKKITVLYTGGDKENETIEL